MNWLNIKLVTLRAPEYIGSEPVARATWLNVIAYCCEQENGGRIVGAKGWKDRQWQQTCGVTLQEVESANSLIQWDSDDLIVWAYPADKEAEIQSKREAGSKGGNSKAKRSRKAQQEESSKHSYKLSASTATSSVPTEGEEEGEGNRNKKKKGNMEEVKTFCVSIGLPESDGQWFFDKCEGNGWINGGKTIKNWQATIRAWKTARYMPSQKNGATEPQHDLPDRTEQLGPCHTDDVFAALKARMESPKPTLLESLKRL